MSKVSSPFTPRGTVTSHFSLRRWLFGRWGQHWGTDVASPVSGPPSVICSPADGTVVGAGTGVLKWHSGNIVVIRHDGFFSIAGHLHRVDVSAGQKVVAGQKVGVEGATGNVTGRHLHVGVYVGGRYERGDLVGGSWVDPYPWYRARGVTLGVSSPVKPASVKPASKSSTSTSKSSGLPSHRTVQARLAAMGLYRGRIDGVNGRVQKSAVSTYQRLNNRVVDGYWGPKTDSAYRDRVRIQQALNRCKGYKIAVDGHMPDRGLTRKRITNVKQRNGLRPMNDRFNPAFKSFLIKIGAWK